MRLIGAAVAVALGAAVLFAQEPLEFGAEVSAVHLDVFVSRDGEPVVGLTSDDFDVRDDGERQAVEIVRRTEAPPLHVVLVLDTSSSVAGARLEDLRAAAADFLEGLGEGDVVTLTSFSHRTRLVAPPQSDPAAIALGELRAGGGTALFDAVYTGLELAGSGDGRRPMVVVFSDGQDGLSWLDGDDVLNAARQSEAVVFAIHSGVAIPSDGTPAGLARLRDPNARFLRTLAEDSGGRLWDASDGSLRAAFGRLLSELQSHYLLRYSPQRHGCATWHDLDVSLARRKGEVRTRRGYSETCPSGEPAG